MKAFRLHVFLIVFPFWFGDAASALGANIPSSGDSLRSFASRSRSAVVGTNDQGMYGVLGGSLIPLSDGGAVNAGVFGRTPRNLGWSGYFEGGLSVREDNPSALNVCRFERATDGPVVWIIGPNGGGDISIEGATVSYNAFTGSHYGWTEEIIRRGSLVRLTGENRLARPHPDSEVIYGVVRTVSANDPRCLGAYLSLIQPSHPPSPTNFHLIMAVGNGDMWVTDSGNGDLEPGDYLISSDVPGCAMKDDPARFPIGYICARTAQGVQWSEVCPDSLGIKRKKISVLFEAFERHSESPGLAAKVDTQQAEIESLKSELKNLHAMKERLAKLEELVLDTGISAMGLGRSSLANHPSIVTGSSLQSIGGSTGGFTVKNQNAETTSSSVALTVQAGAIRIPNAHTSTTTPAFRVTTTSENGTSEPGAVLTRIDHPLLNSDPNALPYLTPNGKLEGNTLVFPFSPPTCTFSPPAEKWIIVQPNREGRPLSDFYGQQYTILVIKP